MDRLLDFLLRSIPSTKISFPFLFSQLLFSISFPSSTPTLVSLFFFFPYSIPFLLTYLVIFQKLMGLRARGPSFSSTFQCHESDRPPCYNILSHFFNFAGSWIQDFILQVPRSPLCTKHFVIYIKTIKFVAGTEPLSISFLLHTIFIDLFSTRSLFFFIHNHGFLGSWVVGFMKMSIFKISLVRPCHLHAFPNMN
jgi:hypothetical protein